MRCVFLAFLTVGGFQTLPPPRQRPNIHFVSRASITPVGAAVRSRAFRNAKPPHPAQRPNAYLTPGTKPVGTKRRLLMDSSLSKLPRPTQMANRAGVSSSGCVHRVVGATNPWSRQAVASKLKLVQETTRC